MGQLHLYLTTIPMKNISLLITPLLIGLFCVYLLYYNSKNNERLSGAFIRNIKATSLNTFRTIQLDTVYEKLEGPFGGYLYLLRVESPQLLCRINLNTFQREIISIPKPNPLRSTVVRSSLLFPYMVFANNRGTIYRSNLLSQQIDSIHLGKGILIDELMPLGKYSIAVRSVKLENRELALGKVTPQGVTWHEGILEKQFDGLFSVDGHLLFNRHANKLFYIYYYRNQITAFDTSFQIKLKTHTIDSFSTARIKIADKYKGRSISMASPRRVTNNLADSYENNLLIQSRVIGLNEDVEAFESSYVFDCYSADNGEYKMSFYIRKSGKSMLRGFKITCDQIILLYSNRLTFYSLPVDLCCGHNN